MLHFFCVTLYSGSDDESGVDKNDAAELSNATSYVSSPSITPSSLRAAVVTEAQGHGAVQVCGGSCPEPMAESRQPMYVARSSAAKPVSTTALTKQQVYSHIMSFTELGNFYRSMLRICCVLDHCLGVALNVTVVFIYFEIQKRY